MTDGAPKIGDVIRTARPLNYDTPWTDQYGKHLTHILTTPDSVEFAKVLIESGRWVIVDPQPQAEQKQ